MLIKYYCDTFNKITYSLWAGESDAAEWLASLRKTIEDPAWAASRIWIIDQTTIKLMTAISVSTLEQVGILLNQHIVDLQNRKIVIVSEDAFYQEDRIQAVLRQLQVNVIVLSDLTSACTYLNLDLATVQREFAWLHADAADQ